MWLIVALVSALIVTILHFKAKSLKKYRLDILALMLWGTFIMVLIDHTMAWLNGEPFIEITTDGLIPNATLLGVIMIIPVLIIWVVAVSTKFGQRICSEFV